MVPHLSKPDYCNSLGLAVGGRRYITLRFESRFFVLSPERRTDYKNAAQAASARQTSMLACTRSLLLPPFLISSQLGMVTENVVPILSCVLKLCAAKIPHSAHQHRRQSKVSPLATSIHACMGEKDLNCVGCGIRQHPLAHKLLN